jgi:nitrate/TMAO reductase-like tetraheme cytochrome c subunit
MRYPIINIILLIFLGIGIVFSQQPKKSDEKNNDDKFKELIRKMENRKIYKKIDEKILAQIPDDDLEMVIIDYIHTKFKKDWRKEDLSKLRIKYIRTHSKEFIGN